MMPQNHAKAANVSTSTPPYIRLLDLVKLENIRLCRFRSCHIVIISCHVRSTFVKSVQFRRTCFFLYIYSVNNYHLQP